MSGVSPTKKQLLSAPLLDDDSDDLIEQPVGSSGGSKHPATVWLFGCKADSPVAEAVRENLVAGMQQDPSCYYFAKQKSKHREAMWRSMISLNYAAARLYSEQPLFFTTSCHCAAVMCFIYPKQQVSLWQYMRLGGLTPMLHHFHPKRWKSAVKHQSALDKQKLAFQETHSSFIYVFLIAMRPEVQRQGLGTMLMERVHFEADKRGLPCYLEASTDGSRQFYTKLGYDDIATIRPEKHKAKAPIYRAMWRAAQLLPSGY